MDKKEKKKNIIFYRSICVGAAWGIQFNLSLPCIHCLRTYRTYLQYRSRVLTQIFSFLIAHPTFPCPTLYYSTLLHLSSLALYFCMLSANHELNHDMSSNIKESAADVVRGHDVNLLTTNTNSENEKCAFTKRKKMMNPTTRII